MNSNIREIYYKIKESTFAKSVILIAGGTAAAQGINVILTPIITRIYSPEEFGVLSLFVALMGILSTVASLRYEWAIPIANDDDEVTNIIVLCFIILILISSSISLTLVVGGEKLMRFFGAEALLDYSYLIPIGVISIGLYNIMIQLSFRIKNYKGISKTKFNQSLSQNITKIFLGILNCGASGLILGNIIGQSAGITTLASTALKSNRFKVTKASKQKIKDSAKRYIKFPIFSASSQFFNSAGLQLPTIIMTAMYGSKIVGYYALANSIISIPMDLIGSSIGDVFYGEAASIGRSKPEELKKLSTDLFKKLILVGILPLVILILGGPLLFSLVFGTSWYQAGIYAQILSLLVFARLIFTPISRIYSVFERQKEAFIIDLLRVVLVIIVFVVAHSIKLTSYYTVGMYTIAMSVIYFITYIVAQRIINHEINIKRINNLEEK